MDVLARLSVSNYFKFVVNAGDSIASEGSGEYLYVEGYVRSTSGNPIADASIETWETDSHGEEPGLWLCQP
jgi:protocatechuate 3,4-dioxygenase beta subunit